MYYETEYFAPGAPLLDSLEQISATLVASDAELQVQYTEIVERITGKANLVLTSVLSGLEQSYTVTVELRRKNIVESVYFDGTLTKTPAQVTEAAETNEEVTTDEIPQSSVDEGSTTSEEEDENAGEETKEETSEEADQVD